MCLIGLLAGLLLLTPNFSQADAFKTVVDATYQSMRIFEQREMDCLSENAYYEARGRSVAGLKAVTLVVLNRMESEHFPNSACEVIHQRTKGRCEFSWLCEKHTGPKHKKEYRIARLVAITVYLHNVYDITDGALFFHASRITTKQAKMGWLTKTREIDGHMFYRLTEE